MLNSVIMSNAVHAYISQSDKGDLVIGAGIDQYTGFGQRGSFQIIEGTLGAIVEMFPAFSRVRMNRQWGGIVDVSPDACPIISKTPVQGLYFNCGWGTGGFKATPGSGWCTPTPSRATRPPAERAVLAGPLLYRPPDRRARRRRRRALNPAWRAACC